MTRSVSRWCGPAASSFTIYVASTATTWAPCSPTATISRDGSTNSRATRRAPRNSRASAPRLQCLAAKAAAAVGAARRKAAPRLAKAIEQHVRTLALGRARLVVEVGDDDPGDDVRFLFAADAGEAPLPLSKIASGGELARTMLAVRLVLTDAPPTLVFDEVDAGVGGEAALAVGRALQTLSGQVLVVTHLAQVAAFADTHVVITKSEHGGRTAASALTVDGTARVAELSRMMTGLAGSGSAQRHAGELLALAGRSKGR